MTPSEIPRLAKDLVEFIRPNIRAMDYRNSREFAEDSENYIDDGQAYQARLRLEVDKSKSRTEAEIDVLLDYCI